MTARTSLLLIVTCLLQLLRFATNFISLRLICGRRNQTKRNQPKLGGISLSDPNLTKILNKEVTRTNEKFTELKPLRSSEEERFYLSLIHI